VSALIYSREALRESHDAQQAEEQRTSPQLSIFDQVPIDAPMPEGLVLGYWADWLGERGEFVSREKYLATMPIERVRCARSDACLVVQPDAVQPKRKAHRRRGAPPDPSTGLFQCVDTD
jgi:hypothetical protein